MTNGEFLQLMRREATFAKRPLLALYRGGVMVTLQFSSEPTRDTFEYLRRFCEFQIEILSEAPSAGDLEYKSRFGPKSDAERKEAQP